MTILDEAVEAATKATFDYTWAEMVQEELVLVELWRGQLRTALETGPQRNWPPTTANTENPSEHS